VFLSDPSKQAVQRQIADVRALAVANGRDPHDVKFYPLATTIVGRTEEEALAKREEYRKYIDYRGTLALFSGWTGIDLSKYDLDDPFPSKKNDTSISSAVDSFSRGDRVWTIRDVVEHNAIGGRGPVFVGSAEQVADKLQEWAEDTDLDGFNLSYAVAPQGWLDFVDLVVPELQRRGAYRTEYSPGSLREKVFGRKSTLPESHPAAAFRPAALTKAAE
jgi:alkanesulfonate monooxygenase